MTRSAPLVLAIGLLVPLLASAQDDCPSDPNKTDPGLCGCGVADSDWDGDLQMDSCIDPTVVLPVGTIVGLAARVDSGATVQTGVVLGPDSHVGAGAFIGTDSFLASQASVGTGSTIGADSVLGRRATVGPNADLGDNAVIGRSASIDGGFTVAAGGTITLGYAAQLNGTPESVGHHITLGNLASVEAASIGNNVVFARSATVGAGTTIGDSVVMGPGADILTDAVIGNGVRMRKYASIGADSNIGDNSRIGRGADIQASACVGADVHLGANAVAQTWSDITDATFVQRGTTVAGEASAPSCLSLGTTTLVSGAFEWDDGTFAGSCNTYLNPIDSHVYSDSGSGIYRIDPTGADPSDAYNVYCDMTTDSGGWTLVHTKVSTSFSPWKATHDPLCGVSTTANCASAVSSELQWSESMWRFSDTEDYLIQHNRADSAAFAGFLFGDSHSNTSISVAGFTRYRPLDGWTGPFTIPTMHFGSAYYTSENHGQSDQWLDLWTNADNTNSYQSVTGAGTIGTKCIAGYCRDATVWMMVR